MKCEREKKSEKQFCGLNPSVKFVHGNRLHEHKKIPRQLFHDPNQFRSGNDMIHSCIERKEKKNEKRQICVGVLGYSFANVSFIYFFSYYNSSFFVVASIVCIICVYLTQIF